MMGQRRHADAGQNNPNAQEAASAIAIAALTFIGEEPERLGQFLALSGIGPESLRAAAREPDFLLGVLDHLIGDEALLLAFAARDAIDPLDVLRARDVLAGKPRQPSP
jgi:hypothetical protein